MNGATLINFRDEIDSCLNIDKIRGIIEKYIEDEDLDSDVIQALTEINSSLDDLENSLYEIGD
jgi:hypothetical protein